MVGSYNLSRGLSLPGMTSAVICNGLTARRLLSWLALRLSALIGNMFIYRYWAAR